jgi:hypothetical protein
MKSHRALLVCVLTTLAGCSTWSWEGLMRRFQSPENTEDAKNTKVIGDFTTPWNMFPAVVENVGLATKLKGTGSDPKPSPQRDLLVGEMQLRGVSSPNAVLVSKDVSMVLVKAILRAGIQEGDRFDVEVRVPSGSETTSLRGGYLLETDLKELKAMEGDHSIHQGWTCGIAEGAVWTRSRRRPGHQVAPSRLDRQAGGPQRRPILGHSGSRQSPLLYVRQA